jgi:hypothetical protein
MRRYLDMQKSDDNCLTAFNRQKFILFILLLSAACFYNMLRSASASAGDKPDILAVGEGRIKGNNTADAKNEAIANALKKGIEEYLSGRLGSQGMIGNFSVLINEVIPSAEAAVENFHILAEEKKGEKYSILMRVRVNEKLIEQKLRDLGIVNAETASIKVLFLVSQVQDFSKGAFFWWKNPEAGTAMTATELKLYNAFQQQGLEPVNRLSNSAEGYSDGMKKPELSNEDASAWGKIFSADIVIRGRAAITSDNSVSVDLDAINTADGTIIGRTNQKEPLNPSDPGEARFANAAGTAINSASIQLAPKILKLSGKTSGNSNRIEITLTDINNFDELRTFKKFLEEEISGVKSARQSRIKGRAMTLSIEYTGSRDVLLSRLKGNVRLPLQGDISAEGEGIAIKVEHEIIDLKTTQDAAGQQDNR